VGLAALLGGQFGYHGDSETYDSLANANLIRVIERRRGLPVALGILWLHAARAAGWEAHGINFPGHFLIGVQAGGRQVVVDVFAGGIPMQTHQLCALARSFEGPQANVRPDMLRPMSTRAVLLRLQNNIKLRRLRAEDIAGAQAANADMLRIAPDEAALWRDGALLHARAGDVAAALASWQRFLALVPAGAAAEHARTTMAELRSRLH
jgi:regulator of sirC expression with transglutaminase-like and TPR domain